MKRWKDLSSPFNNIRLSFEANEIDQICENALAQEKLFPTTPEAIRIDRFVEKYFQIGGVEYENLGADHLGYTSFTKAGQVQRIVVSSFLSESCEQSSLRRERSTIAHEAGHGLLHASLFIDDNEMLIAVQQHLAKNQEKGAAKIMCRKDDIQAAQADYKGYKGKWWEWQANRAIGGLLLPRKLVQLAVTPFLTLSKVSIPELLEERRSKAVVDLAKIFDVNPAVVKIRLQEMYPPPEANSLF